MEDIFYSALEQAPEDRPSFLDSACGPDSELRQEVERLLANEEQAASFLEAPAVGGPPADSQIGRQLGPYRIVALLGSGGMGEVYRAHDGNLGRDVAIKTLPPEFARNPDRLARFRREARTLASLNHPNIGAIYGLEESAEADCLVLELVEGQAPQGPMPLPAALDCARQVAEALEAAHDKGIVHRDLKPANVRITPQGRVKVLDFGLAKAIWGSESNPDPSQSSGHIIGTPGYMSPEQARGKDVDRRTDIWAFGCLLYEFLAGRRAFQGETVSDVIAAVLEHEPAWNALPANTPAKIRELLRTCLEKGANRRLSNIADARTTIEEAQRGLNRRRLFALRPRFFIPAAAILLLLGFLGVRFYQHNSRVRWVREQVIPELSQLLDAGQRQDTFRLVRRAEAVAPNDPALKQVLRARAIPTSFNTNPPGAEVWAIEYGAEDNGWLYLGRTPFTAEELPYGYYRLRIVKSGFQTILGAGGNPGAPLEFDLDAAGSIPPDMVRVPGGTVSIPGLDEVKLGAFLIDRCEITNRQFKQFIDGGGYRKREYWKQEFVQNGRKLAWEGAMELFRDSSGRPGPSTWEFGEYPQGHDDYPVNGVSWYEAAAYAEFAGKQLPTIYHWQKAASPGFFADEAEVSNFSGAGPARVGAYKGLGPFGALDMAGNVKEWCWNATGAKRYIRGGAWNEPAYMFAALDARLSWDRSAQNGIRCVRYDGRAESGLQGPVTRPPRDYSKEKPVSDEVFQTYQSLYAYDPTELDSRVEGIDEENAYWTREKISFASSYGKERIAGYFYIPKRGAPPYQAIVYVAPSMAYWFPSPRAEEPMFDHIIKSGRAFLVPVVKGHYERRYATPAAGPNETRDRLILESKDFRRSIDYMVSRADVDRERLGVFGVSLGVLAPVMGVAEQRLKVAVLSQSGLFIERRQPEADPFNFLPRFRVPTLMVNGRTDFIFPIETLVRPMFRLLGAPEKDKRLLLRDGGHAQPGGQRMITVKEELDWFDRYLGPVK